MSFKITEIDRVLRIAGIGAPINSNEKRTIAAQYQRRGNSTVEWHHLSTQIPNVIQSTLRSIGHEVVDSCRLFSECKGDDSLDMPYCYTLPLSAYGEEGVLFRRTLVEAIKASGICWFCRFISRICAQFMTEDHFAECWTKNLPILVVTGHGDWEFELNLSKSTSEPAVSHKIEVGKLPSGDSSGRMFPGGVHLTCHNLDNPPSRKLRKLLSDTIWYQAEYFEMIRDWLSFCEARHSTCGKTDNSPPRMSCDLRVIDVENRNIITVGNDCRYVALSYVWGLETLVGSSVGDASVGSLDRLAHEANFENKVPENIPKTIEDAMTVTKGLGERYLWADYFCIDQTNAKIKQRAIDHMDAVYARALLTICVLDGENMFSGVPGVNESHIGRVQVITDTESERYMATNLISTHDTLEGCDWAQRGWTFQEGILSTRRLCFDINGVFLLCREEVFHDVLTLDESIDRETNRFNAQGAYYLSFGFNLDMTIWDFDIYARMTACYSGRKLSSPLDAQNAVSGALQRISETSGITFVSALPVEDLFNGLLWFHHMW